jgi:hypothetical protein
MVHRSHPQAQEARAYFAAEIGRYAKLVKDIGLKIE